MPSDHESVIMYCAVQYVDKSMTENTESISRRSITTEWPLGARLIRAVEIDGWDLDGYDAVWYDVWEDW